VSDKSMELTDLNLSEKGFSNVKQDEIPGNTSEEDIFGDVGKEKIEALEKSISEIKTMVLEREKLSRISFTQCEKLKTEISNFLLENQASALTEEEHREVLRQKNDLRHKKIEISEMQLKEKVDCWKDTAILKRELRVYEQELNEKLARQRSLSELLEE
jgi:Fe-S cluster biosynthesis and repair protein YggX